MLWSRNVKANKIELQRVIEKKYERISWIKLSEIKWFKLKYEKETRTENFFVCANTTIHFLWCSLSLQELFLVLTWGQDFSLWKFFFSYEN